ncbi:hypothetical protein I7I50_07621 [Histoplasma capsulatum G186AR]|uniref:Uncharacterized protein n=1 Tax=Ajellomyces capsulatus TaxID=5037 RepID=A0A8H7YXX4_AJECA|nr:hypothetical protein I7I52_09307 [Histoplasma capsulatum]QSS68269.1 hypothetical protein I7I50_07621 [Histoplasma capsulatum G186AR]
MKLWVALELFPLFPSIENMALRVFQISTGPFRGVVILADLSKITRLGQKSSITTSAMMLWMDISRGPSHVTYAFPCFH